MRSSTSLTVIEEWVTLFAFLKNLTVAATE
jgi:hypothetical protein